MRDVRDDLNSIRVSVGSRELEAKTGEQNKGTDRPHEGDKVTKRL